MRFVAAPSITAAAAYAACVSGVDSQPLKERFQAVASHIDAAARDFTAAASMTNLHTIQSTSDVAGLVSVEEMRWLYTHNMVRRNGRGVYNQLRSIATDGVCLLCGHLRASTLDHHLPKAQFPALAVAPLNLVPCCKDCNMAKVTRVPTCAEEETLHPYFDNVEGDRWLAADVAPGAAGPTLRFGVKPPSHWTPLLAARATHHFRVFKLGILYVTQAHQELASIRHTLVNLHKEAGAGSVRNHLATCAESRRTWRINAWQTATYQALAASDWFCESGLHLIPGPKAA